ncbi:hypothetical protein [Paraburkholderia sp. J10-1]|uniref:hypothetical protein n=1 Tax=Paraburkholderia sp. J10-1 TaxID=2805430 RepID=UPI002AB72B22|nr:hypothetical protein [Paraburkholderia sp. J10-1]
MIGLMPAEVDSVSLDDRKRRIYRVRIPGLTDGAAEMPQAKLCNPMGDRSENTEIRIKPGDRVWLAFECGDTRYPVIVGFRPRNVENDIDWRRFEHANFQFNADNTFEVIANTTVHVKTQQAVIESQTTLIDSKDTRITGTLTVEKLLTFNGGMAGKGGEGGGDAVKVDGGAYFTKDVMANGVSTSGHKHNTNGDHAPTDAPTKSG